MADQDLEIRIRTEADLAAIKQWESEIDKLVQKVSSARDRLSGGINRGFLGPLPPELLTPGPLGEGPLSARAQELLSKDSGGLTHVAAEMERAASAGTLLGANLTRARAEAIILARELATGVPTTRTLSSLMSALGYQIAGAGIGLFVVAEGVKTAIQQQQKFNEELQKENEHITDNISKWREELSAVSSVADVEKVIASTIPEIEKGERSAAAAAEHHLGFWQTLFDTIIKVERTTNPLWYALRNSFVTFDDLAKQTEKGFKEAADRQNEAAADAIRSARNVEAAFNQMKGNPVQAVNELTDAIQRAREQQDGLDLTTKEGLAANIKSWNDYQRQIDNNIKVISQLNDIISKSQANLDKAEQSASRQTKDVIANEQAAQQARAQGREREADLYEKSAKQFEQSMTSQQAAELENIRRLQAPLQPPPDTRSQIQKDIDANRKAYEEYWSQPGMQQAAGGQPYRNIPPNENMIPTRVEGTQGAFYLELTKHTTLLERIAGFFQQWVQ